MMEEQRKHVLCFHIWTLKVIEFILQTFILMITNTSFITQNIIDKREQNNMKTLIILLQYRDE